MLGVKARVLSRDRNSIVYVSHDLRRTLEPRLGIPSHLGTVVHNGITPSNPFVESHLRTELRLRSQEILVGAVGNVRGPKDYPNLLRAARLVLDQQPDVHFVVAGDDTGPRGEAIKRLRGDLRLEGRFHFLGFRKEATALMGAVDLFVSSSSSEGLPLSTLEAQFLGIPVVLTSVGGVPEIVDHGRTGLLVPPGDPRALAEGILRLLEEPDLAKRLAAEGQERVKKGFSLTVMMEGYEHLYRRLITSGS